MNKKFENYFKELGFEIQNNNAYGMLRNYETSVRVNMFDNKTPLMIHIAFYADGETKRNIVNQIRDLKIKNCLYESNVYGLMLGLNDLLSVGSLIKKLPNILDNILNVIEANNVLGTGYCPVSGDELGEEAKKYSIEWLKLSLSDASVENLNAVIAEENKDFEEAPNNYLRGTIGALIGAAVGAISLIILFFVGFVSALSSFIAIALGTVLYKKFGGKPNRIMIVIVSTISILSMLLAVFLLYLFFGIAIAPEFGIRADGFDAFLQMMKVKEFATEFVTNLLLTLFFSVLGVVGQIVALFKSTQRASSIK